MLPLALFPSLFSLLEGASSDDFREESIESFLTWPLDSPPREDPDEDGLPPGTTFPLGLNVVPENMFGEDDFLLLYNNLWNILQKREKKMRDKHNTLIICLWFMNLHKYIDHEA